MGFKVGNRIITTVDIDELKSGAIGTIKDCENVFGYAVEFDNKFNYGHDCFGQCKNGYGYYVSEQEIKLLSKSKTNNFLPDDVESVIINNRNVIVILTDGRKGVSKALDTDTFDEFTGFAIAYYKAKNQRVFELKKILHNCVESAKKKGYKQAILKNKN